MAMSAVDSGHRRGCIRCPTCFRLLAGAVRVKFLKVSALRIALDKCAQMYDRTGASVYSVVRPKGAR